MPRGTRTTDPDTAMKAARSAKSTTKKAPAKKAPATSRKAPTKTEYVMEEVDALPPANHGGRRSELLVNLDKLRDAAVADPKKVGRWVMVARYDGREGAQVTIRNIKNGTRQAPEGLWEFESRISANAKPGQGPSELYARYLGETEADLATATAVKD